MQLQKWSMMVHAPYALFRKNEFSVALKPFESTVLSSSSRIFSVDYKSTLENVEKAAALVLYHNRYLNHLIL